MGTADRRKAFSFEKEDNEPLELEINGDTVTAVNQVDGLKLLEFTATMRGVSTTGARAGAIVRWLKVCFGVDVDAGEETSEAYKQFQKVTRAHHLDIEDLSEISGYLADVYSERPTKSAESSTTGRKTTGDGSADSSSSDG